MRRYSFSILTFLFSLTVLSVLSIDAAAQDGYPFSKITFRTMLSRWGYSLYLTGV